MKRPKWGGKALTLVRSIRRFSSPRAGARGYDYGIGGGAAIATLFHALAREATTRSYPFSERR